MAVLGLRRALQLGKYPSDVSNVSYSVEWESKDREIFLTFAVEL